MSKIINKVPHPVIILDEDNRIIKTYPKSNGMIRLAQTTTIVGELDGVPISKTEFGLPEQLPPYEENVYYIVSHLVKTALPRREDLLIPSNVVRDDVGQIIGCRSLDK